MSAKNVVVGQEVCRPTPATVQSDAWRVLEGALVEWLDGYHAATQATVEDDAMVHSVHALLDAMRRQSGHSMAAIRSYFSSAWAV